MTAAAARVQAFFDEHRTGLKVLLLDQDTSTSQLAADALGVEVGQIAKSLLFKAKDVYFMIVASGDQRIDGKRVKDLAGSRVRMATAEETLSITGYPVGGVCPFVLATDIPVYIDDGLKRFGEIFPAAGTSNSAVPTTYEDLKRITSASPCSVCLSEDRTE